MIVAGLCVAVITSIVTIPIKHYARRISLLDLPDERKIHQAGIPCLGGLSLFVVGTLSLAFFMRFYPPAYLFRDQIPMLIIGSAVICAMGVWDDVRGSGALPKLLVQGLVGVMMYFAGFRIEQISLPVVGIIQPGFLGFVGTVFWFCLVINAINLIDGLDGLAAGLAVIAAGTILMISFSWSRPLATFLAIIIIGSAIGFLPHNFYPAKIFLGDSGSMLLGFWLASLSLLTSTKAPALLTLLIPIIAIGLPVFDTLFAFFRRVRDGEHPFRADKRHIHHRLMALGYSHKHTVILLYIVSMYLGLTAYLLSLSQPFVTFLTLALLVLGSILVVDIFRHTPEHGKIEYKG